MALNLIHFNDDAMTARCWAKELGISIRIINKYIAIHGGAAIEQLMQDSKPERKNMISRVKESSPILLFRHLQAGREVDEKRLEHCYLTRHRQKK
jgi:hypothetical protein